MVIHAILERFESKNAIAIWKSNLPSSARNPGAAYTVGASDCNWVGNRLVVEGIHIPEKGNPGTHSSAEDIDHIRSAAGTDNSPAGKDILAWDNQSLEAFALVVAVLVALVVAVVVVVALVVVVGHFAGLVVVALAALVASGLAFLVKEKVTSWNG